MENCFKHIDYHYLGSIGEKQISKEIYGLDLEQITKALDGQTHDCYTHICVQQPNTRDCALYMLRNLLEVLIKGIEGTPTYDHSIIKTIREKFVSYIKGKAAEVATKTSKTPPLTPQKIEDAVNEITDQQKKRRFQSMMSRRIRSSICRF